MAGLRFPITGFKEIPLFITFTARDYTNRRANRVAGGGNFFSQESKLVQFTLPVPTNMTSSTNIDFERGKTNETPIIEGLLGMFTDQGGGARSFGSLLASLPLIGRIASPNFIRDITVGGQLGLVDQDRSEMLFNQAQFRTFQFNFSMVAKNRLDAERASEIANAAEAFALPSPDIVNQKMFHPPLWQWYVTAQGAGKTETAKLWAGQPQTSVLTAVTVNRTGAGGAFSVTDKSGGSVPKPLVTNLSLTFTELEPNLQNLGEIISRSAALTRDSF